MTASDDSNVGSAGRNVLPQGYQLHWYEIGKVIGKGGFGITYAGRDTNLDQSVAIKEYFPDSYAMRDATDTVRPDSESSEDTYNWGLRRFLDEAQTLAKFRHPAIVRVSSVFEANGTAYMVMDHESGESLTEVSRAGKIDGQEKLLGIVLPLLDGLDQVHAIGFIHRDIKPANIIVRDNGFPVLLDFGAARQSLEGEHGQLTTVGTRSYAPFEQFDGSGDLKQGPWTDIYSFGAVLYEIVSGERPIDSMQRGTALLEGRKDPLRLLDRTALAERYSTGLLQAIEHALAFKLTERPQSVAEWRSLYPMLDVGSGQLRPEPPQDAIEPTPDTSPDSADDRTASPEAATEPNLTLFKSLHAMVVDDEPFVLNLAKRVLGRLGLEMVTTASDGESALAALGSAQRAPDVILCDLKMPGMDGLELLRRLGEQESAIAFILISGEDEKILRTAENLGKAHDLRILGVLPKPISLEPLSRLLLKLERTRTTQPPWSRVAGVSENELDEALQGGALIAVFQPKVSVRTRKVEGVEALARLNHPERGILGPGAFIPLAEESGRMAALTEAVFKHAAARAGAWQADGTELHLSVNVSTENLRDLGFAERITEWVAAEGLRSSQVTLEVTETRVMQDVRASLETMSRLRLNDFRLSIDDFGTGHSSLEQLKRAPFSELKIDRQFVAGASQDAAARAILEWSVSLARRLDLEVVAEGVETEEDWDLVKELGCGQVQGYFVAKPMPGEEIPEWIAQWSASS